MPNPNPESRVGVALLFIGGVSASVFLLSVWAGNAPNPWILLGIVITLLAGWGSRRAFRSSRPPSPSIPFAARLKARLGSVAMKPAAPAKPGASGPPKPAAAPPPKKGKPGFLKPKTKAPPKK